MAVHPIRYIIFFLIAISLFSLAAADTGNTPAWGDGTGITGEQAGTGPGTAFTSLAGLLFEAEGAQSSSMTVAQHVLKEQNGSWDSLETLSSALLGELSGRVSPLQAYVDEKERGALAGITTVQP